MASRPRRKLKPAIAGTTQSTQNTVLYAQPTNLRFENGMDFDNNPDAYMFNLLDTVHDIFDRESELTGPQKEMFGISYPRGERPSAWQKIDAMLLNVYNLSPSKMYWKTANVKRTFPYLIAPPFKDTFNRSGFSAKSFLEYWSYKTLGYYCDASTERGLIVSAINKAGLDRTRRYLQQFGVDPDSITTSVLKRLVSPRNMPSNSPEYKSLMPAFKSVFGIIEFKTLAEIKQSLVDAVFTQSLLAAYTFHTKVGQQNNLINMRNTVDIKTTKVMEAIFAQYDRIMCVVDATKGSLKKARFMMTPAQLLDPSTTPVNITVNLALPFFTLKRFGTQAGQDEFLQLTFNQNEIFNQQLTCKFFIQMYVVRVYPKSQTPASRKYAADINAQLFDKFDNVSSEQTFLLLRDVHMKYVQSSVLVVAYTTNPSNAADRTTLVLSSEPFSKQVVRTVVDNFDRRSLKSTIQTTTGSANIILKTSFSGMSVSECLSHIRDKLSTASNNQRKQMFKQYYLDWKRMGDSFQVSFLEAVNRATRRIDNQTNPFVYFASQDILAVCQAIGVGHVKDPIDKLSFIFNTGGSNNWMIGTNITHEAHKRYMAVRKGDILTAMKSRNREATRIDARRAFINSYTASNRDRVDELFIDLDSFDLSPIEKQQLASYLTSCDKIRKCQQIMEEEGMDNDNNSVGNMRKRSRPNIVNYATLRRRMGEA
jgi:hypothetical protein